jgi:hypothetical protein
MKKNMMRNIVNLREKVIQEGSLKKKRLSEGH